MGHNKDKNGSISTGPLTRGETMNKDITEYQKTSLTTARVLRAFLIVAWGSFFSYQFYQEGQRILAPDVVVLGALDQTAM